MKKSLKVKTELRPEIALSQFVQEDNSPIYGGLAQGHPLASRLLSGQYKFGVPGGNIY